MKRNTGFLLSAIFLGALVIRIFNCLILTGGLEGKPIPKTDAVEYDLLAKNIVSLKAFQYGPECPATCFRPPLYPFFLALIYSVFGVNYAIVRIIQLLLSAGCCCLIWYLAFLLTDGDRRISLIASIISVIYPSMFFHSGFLLTESIYIFFILIACCALARLQRNPSLGNKISSGIMLALLCLLRSNAIFFPMLLFFWAILVFDGCRRALSIYLSVILIFCLTLSPWIIRNYLQFKKFTFISCNGGMNFWGSNNPVILGDNLKRYEAWKGGIIYDVSCLPGSEDLTDSWQSKEFNQFELDSRCWRLALNYLKNNPDKIHVLLFNKIKRFWSGEIRNEMWQRMFFVVLDQGMLPFALLGFFVSLRYKKPPYLLLMLLLAVQINALVFFANTRMRVGIAPSVVVFAAIGIDYLLMIVEKNTICGHSKL